MDAPFADLGTLRRLGGDATEHAERSLVLLRAIEDTISALCYERPFFDLITSKAQKVADDLQHAPQGAQIDPNGELEEVLAKAQSAAKELYTAMLARRNSAEQDDDLTAEDGVVEEYTRSVAAVADMHNSLNTLRWAISEHDANLEKPGGETLKSAEELERFLDAL